MIPHEGLIVAVAAEMELIAKDLGLTCYPQVFEWVTPDQMAMLIARGGGRLTYPHWSYGKAYRLHLRQRETFRDTLDAHELVINANPCVAYLVENTDTAVMVLVIAHVYGHNDFFRNNIAFRDSNPSYLLPLREVRAARVRELEATPGIGVERVEALLDAARSVMYHRTGFKPEDPMWLEFFAENSRLEDWERELILTVNDEAKEELRYIQTKTMNEGWASFWQMEFIFRSTVLPFALKDGAVRFHAQLTAPPLEPTLGYNPYNLGFLLWRSVRDRFGRDELFSARTEETDTSFFERYLVQEVGAEANLAWFEFGNDGRVLRMVRAADACPEDWERIKTSVIAMLPINLIPRISLADVSEQRVLVMRHFHDGRDLDIAEAKQVLSQVARFLWKGSVWLMTGADTKETRLRANERGK